MSGQELIELLTSKQLLLSPTIKKMGDYGKELAQAENNYQVALHQRVLELKDEGYNATFISTIIRGEPTVAKARLERDIADVMYSTARESVNGLKKQLGVLETLIKLEH